MAPEVRSPNLFEKILLVIGILVLIVGFAFIQKIATAIGFGWELLMLIFLWLILVTLIIVLSATENMKEELKIVTNAELAEVRLLREEFKRKR